MDNGKILSFTELLEEVYATTGDTYILKNATIAYNPYSEDSRFIRIPRSPSDNP
ncbi:MAG TPA: hypothetical protein ACFCUD_03675 [Cyclobacteriaceae bacterium]